MKAGKGRVMGRRLSIGLTYIVVVDVEIGSVCWWTDFRNVWCRLKKNLEMRNKASVVISLLIHAFKKLIKIFGLDTLLFDEKKSVRKNVAKSVRNQWCLTAHFFLSNHKVDILNFAIWRVNFNYICTTNKTTFIHILPDQLIFHPRWYQ